MRPEAQTRLTRRFASVLLAVTACLTTGCATVSSPEPTVRPDKDKRITLTSPLPESVDRAQLQRVLAHPPPQSSTLSDPAEWRFDTLAWVYQRAGWRLREYREVVGSDGVLSIIVDAQPIAASSSGGATGQ